MKIICVFNAVRIVAYVICPVFVTLHGALDEIV